MRLSAGLVIRAAARIEPYAAPGAMLCTEELLGELDERSRPLFTPVGAAALRGTGVRLADDRVTVIRKHEQDEPVETRHYRVSLG